MINRFHSPESAVAQYDEAVRSGDLSAVLACFSFERAAEEYGESLNEHYRDEFLALIDERELKFLRRSQGGSSRYAECNDDRTVIDVERTAVMEDGSVCDEVFQTAQTDNGWRLLRRISIQISQHHPLLSAIKYDGYTWNFQRHLNWLGVVANISIDAAAEEAGLRPDECETAAQMSEHAHDLKPTICAEVFKMYNDCYYGAVWYGEDESGNDLSEQYAPKLARPAEIWPLIWPPFYVKFGNTQSFQGPRNKDPFHPGTFYFSCECSWDQEHGLNMDFEDWNIVEVGS